MARWQHACSLPAAAMTRPGGSLTQRVRLLLAGGHAARTGARRLGLAAGVCAALTLMVAAPKVDAKAPHDSPMLGALDKSLIDAVILEDLSGIRRCYDQRLREEPSLEGELVTHFRIEADGRVGHTEVKRSTLDDRAVEQCVLGRLEDLRFPAPKGGGIVIVSYPFVFSAG